MKGRIRAKKMRLSHQINNYYCGPAVVVMVLRAHGIHATQRSAARLLHTTKAVGTSTKRLVGALRSFSLRVNAGNGLSLKDIHRALQEKSIVIVCYTEPREHQGHYAVVAGFRGTSILLFSPDERGDRPVLMPLKEFEERWHDPLFTRSKRWAAFVHFSQ